MTGYSEERVYHGLGRNMTSGYVTAARRVAWQDLGFRLTQCYAPNPLLGKPTMGLGVTRNSSPR